jgi:4-hydroxy-tetrahydrodipicolinate synthase
MPYFFPYAQTDLAAFCRKVAVAVETPILLYNLPQFTSPLEPETSVRLIQECETIVGIKDSSGSLDTLRMLTERGIPSRRMVGNDGILAQALREKVADGVISGVACALPELIQQIFDLGMEQPPGAGFAELVSALDLFLKNIQDFPIPWGLKIVAEARGLGPADFSLPLSAEREKQRTALAAWILAHLAEMRIKLPQA